MTNTTNTNPLTYAQARKHAVWLDRNGASNVKVIESVTFSTIIVAYDNRCGMPRTVATLADFIEAKEEMA